MTLPSGHIFAGLPTRAADAEQFLDGRIVLHCGDCLEAMGQLAENSIDACVCDPPYHLQSIHKRFAAKGRDETSERYAAGPYGRHAKGFMGKVWDGGDIAFQPETWAAVYRVLKPGGHLLAVGGTRTYHRMVCAIEDAGFEIRDCISWLYGSGFPKSHDVSKAIDKRLGAERTDAIGKSSRHGGGIIGAGTSYEISPEVPILYAPATDLAAQWSGWGTALKPALEPICLARKPLGGRTVAENVLEHGTGALNIDGCRIPAGTEHMRGLVKYSNGGALAEMRNGGKHDFIATDSPLGRWPANIIHDGSDEVVAAFPETASGGGDKRGGCKFFMSGDTRTEPTGHEADSGSAARFFKSCNGRDGEASAERRYTDTAVPFGLLPGARRDGVEASRLFYTSKADGDDRLGSRHPTVKPIDLMQYLVRLVTPKGGTVLDPFAGTGTTGEAAFREGMRAVLIEREAEYQADIRRRMALVLAGPDERSRESVKARGKIDEPGPLFAWKEAQ
jgi:DNA modification methylase